jgi:hypothetical protein
MASEYKASKEAFVSGMTGSTVFHVNMISGVALVCISRHPPTASKLTIVSPRSPSIRHYVRAFKRLDPHISWQSLSYLSYLFCYP